MSAVLKHELRSYFHSLTAYVFGAFLLAFVGIGSVLYNLQAAVSNFEYVLSFSSLIFVVIVPILTMRVIAEERKQKTDQLLYSLPITTTQVILGKYLSLLVLYLIPLAVISLYPLIFAQFGDVYLLTSYGSILAFFIMGAALIALGMFISSLTDNQGLAAGIGSAIYLAEYAGRGNRLVTLIRLTAETLSGIPSIVYGLFGYLLFNISLKWGNTILGGTLTLAIMILPLVMRTTEEALRSVPDSFREGSFGLGAGRLRTVFAIVLPSAAPGILSGVILAVGRIVGETAALIFTAGTAAKVPDTLMGSGRTLAVHMYALFSEGFYFDEAYAAAVVLLVLVVGLNALSAYAAKRFTKGV